MTSIKNIRWLLAAGLVIYMFSVNACSNQLQPVDEGDIAPEPLDPNLVVSSETCQTCHPQHHAEWEMSMHAYSAQDPIFFALNDIGQERSHGELGQFCAACHTPFGSRMGETIAGFTKESLSDKALEGVSCMVCHSATEHSIGEGIKDWRFDTTFYGNIQNPQMTAAHGSEYSEFLTTSEFCASCHNVTNPNGFVSERTYSEWKASIFPGRGLDCQSCHMKSSTGPVVPGGPDRTIHDHIMIGVDVPLTDFPGREESIALAAYNLQYALKMKVIVPEVYEPDSTMRVVVNLFNDITGHNLPSGTILERQMWVELFAVDKDNGDTVFKTGYLDPNQDLYDKHSEYVKAGEPKDTHLVLYNGTGYRNGVETPFFWEADAIENRTIPAFESRDAVYDIPASQLFDSQGVDVHVRLLFRAMPPWLLRDLGHEELVEKLPLFEMEFSSKEVVR